MGVRRVVCGGCWFLLGFVGFLTVEKKDPYHWHEYSEISQTWMSLDEGCSSHHWNSILALSRKWYPAMTLNHTCWNGTLTRTLPISFHGIWLSLLNFDGKLNSPVLRCQRSPHLYSLLRKTESCAGSLQKGLVSSQTPIFSVPTDFKLSWFGLYQLVLWNSLFGKLGVEQFFSANFPALITPLQGHWIWLDL